MDIDWDTIETERSCSWGNRMDAPQFIPAGSHYDAGDSLGPMGRIIGRAGNWPMRCTVNLRGSNEHS